MSKVFSYIPSIDGRVEPPSSQAVVVHYDKKTHQALVVFRGKTYQARSCDGELTAGESVSFVECPRNSYWVRRSGISWYENPLENWIKGGHPAGAALEYLLRKNPKYNPFRVMIGDDGEPKLIEIPPNELLTAIGDFNDYDDDRDGYISLDEWLRHGGKESDFRGMDKNGDGKIDRNEFNNYTQKKHDPAGQKLAQDPGNDKNRPVTPPAGPPGPPRPPKIVIGGKIDGHDWTPYDQPQIVHDSTERFLVCTWGSGQPEFNWNLVNNSGVEDLAGQFVIDIFFYKNTRDDGARICPGIFLSSGGRFVFDNYYTANGGHIAVTFCDAGNPTPQPFDDSFFSSDDYEPIGLGIVRVVK